MEIGMLNDHFFRSLGSIDKVRAEERREAITIPLTKLFWSDFLPRDSHLTLWVLSATWSALLFDAVAESLLFNCRSTKWYIDAKVPHIKGLSEVIAKFIMALW